MDRNSVDVRRLAPHAPQNLLWAGLVAPHCEHVIGNPDPHCVQKRLVGGLSALQLRHFIEGACKLLVVSGYSPQTCNPLRDAVNVPMMEKRVARASSLRSLSALWPAQSEITLGAEDIAVKACDPLPPARSHVQVLNGGLDMWRNAVPKKLRV